MNESETNVDSCNFSGQEKKLNFGGKELRIYSADREPEHFIFIALLFSF